MASKSNFLYLGIAILFITFAVLQISIPGLLPFAIYYFVAFASFELAFLELIKAILKLIKSKQSRNVHLKEAGEDYCDRHISVLSKVDAAQAEVKKYQKIKEVFSEDECIEKNDKRIRAMEKAVNIITVIEMLFLFSSFAQAIVHKVPNELKENKTICVLSLLTIALLFISYFITSKAENDTAEIETMITNDSRSMNYYLKLIESLTRNTEEERKNEKDQDL